ncbi:MAG: glutathione transferase GstA [Kiloniellales bacterium]
MKLYIKPGACSLASHIALREVGATFDIEKVDTKAQKTESGEDYSKINPNGYVPALRLDDGQVLSEGAALLQYIADQHPQSKLAPAPGTIERTRLQQYLNFIASGLHQAFGPFFGPSLSDEARSAAEARVAKKLSYMESLLADGRSYLLGDSFSVADAYLFVVSNWSNFVGIDLGKWPKLAAFVERVAQRDATQAAMRAEGLSA